MSHIKKNMLRKFVCLLLIFTLTLPAGIIVFASSTIDKTHISSTITDGDIQQEIENEKARIYQDIYQQLEAQNATGLMDEFVAELTPDIEQHINSKYGLLVAQPASSNSLTYVLDGGGVMKYVSTFDTHVVRTCLLPHQSAKHIIPGEIFSILEIIAGISGATQSPWGGIFAVLINMYISLSVSQNNTIEANDGYAQIVTISTPSGSEKGTIVLGWKDSFPFVSIPDDSEQISIKYFYN